MKAEAKSVKEIFGGGPQKLVVPFFQRRYVWKEENWAELLSSIEGNREVQVFLGSIIIKWGENREPSEATIVDGQQRLTTLSLLTKAIYDEFDDEMRENVKDTIQNVLFYKRNTTDALKNSEIKIAHSRVDRDAYGEIIRKGVFEGEKPEAWEVSCIGQTGKCYHYYREVLHKMQQQELKDIFDIMYSDNNKMLVRIELMENDVNEQSIFDTINRAGARLSTADIIKNNLFQRFMESCENDPDKIQEVSRMYDEKWDRFFYSEKEENEWDEERRFGNVGRNNLEFLLYCVASIKWAKADTRDFSGNLETVYTRETRDYGFMDYKELVDEIYEYARIFSRYITGMHRNMADKEEAANTYFSWQKDVKRLLLVLEEFGIQMFYPFVLKIMKEAKGDFKDRRLIAQSRALESFIIRRRIMGTSVSDYTSKCNLILNRGVEQLFSTVGEKEINISDAEIKSQLTKMKSDTAKMILFLIEISRRTKNSDEDALTYTYTLEHIMPKKWQENWSVPENYAEKRQKHIDDLGNLTLLRNSLNCAVKNSDFKTKIEGIPGTKRQKPKEGYKGNVSLNITEEIVRQYDNGMKDWNEDRIEERRNRFAVEIIALWPLYSGGIGDVGERN